MKPRIALITHETSLVGGLPTMVKFLHRAITQSGRYQSDLISLATSAADPASVQLRAPRTWFGGARLEQLPWHEWQFTHAGVWGSELEFQRYQPRRKLNELLKQYDLLQFIVGSPPWGCVAAKVDRPLVLWTATTTRADRASQMRYGSLALRTWRSSMVSLAERYERRALREADAVLALSQYTLSALQPLIAPKRVALAPCGVDTELFHPTAAPARKYILCVARHSDPRKNVRLLIDAYVTLKKKFKTLPDLCLVGDSPTAATRDLFGQLGIAENVVLLEPQGGYELAELYRHAMFFVLSSNEEGLGIVILEAMASGLPVVSTDCGGPSTAIEDGRTGFLTPVGDVSALAEGMEKLVVDSALCARMGAEGRRVAEEQFSLTAAGRVFLDTYDQLLRQHPSAATSAALSETEGFHAA